MNQQLTPGRIVRYVEDAQHVWPAMVVALTGPSGRVDLQVFTSEHVHARPDVRYVAPPENQPRVPNTWHWPPPPVKGA